MRNLEWKLKWKYGVPATYHIAMGTDGERGCYVSEKGAVTHVKARKVTGEIDFCGAGDTFLSGLAVATAAGFALADAARIACCASSVTIKKLKTTGTASRAELANALPFARGVCRIVGAGLSENIGDYAALAVANLQEG